LDTLVLASWKEPLGMVQLEGMAMEKPIVATRIPPHEQILSDKETAILVDPENEQMLADAFLLLDKNKNLARRIGKNAGELANKFTWEERAKGLQSLFFSILKTKTDGAQFVTTNLMGLFSDLNYYKLAKPISILFEDGLHIIAPERTPLPYETLVHAQTRDTSGKISVSIYEAGLQADLGSVDAVADALTKLEEVCFVAITTGAHDLFASVVLGSSEQLGSFLRNKVGVIPGFRQTETYLNLDIKKRTYGLVV